MTEPQPGGAVSGSPVPEAGSRVPEAAGTPEKPPQVNLDDAMMVRFERRRSKIRDEIERNRAGGHQVPTWALAAVLGLLVLGCALLVLVP